MINSKKFYTLGEIVRDKLIPGIKTIPMATRLIHSDAVTNKILKGARVARGAFGVQYKVRGENIIKYLAYLDDQRN